MSCPNRNKDILSKYKCVYLVGNFNIGKTTLARVLVGDKVPKVRVSTDGIWLYIGLAGMDIEDRKWIFLPKGKTLHTNIVKYKFSLEHKTWSF